jgi:hypothetical protein
MIFGYEKKLTQLLTAFSTNCDKLADLASANNLDKSHVEYAQNFTKDRIIELKKQLAFVPVKIVIALPSVDDVGVNTDVPMGDVKTELSDVKTDAPMGDVKTELSDVKTDAPMGDVKTELSDVKTDAPMGDVKTELSDVKTELSEVKTELSDVKTDAPASNVKAESAKGLVEENDAGKSSARFANFLSKK